MCAFTSLVGVFLFLSTLSLRRATHCSTGTMATSAGTFLSTLSLRRATWWSVDVPGWILGISIHALLAESDGIFGPRTCSGRLFLSTLSLRRATTVPDLGKRDIRFLSTLSLRRATANLQRSQHQKKHFYPRSPCGERHPSPSGTAQHTYFYPRSPCGERLVAKRTTDIRPLFLSTLSLRRATYTDLNSAYGALISIHALLAESDPQNWRKPHEQKTFLSTLSLRRATRRHRRNDRSPIHFYPRSPCGERLSQLQCILGRKYFYPRSPCGERLPVCALRVTSNVHFYPRSPCGERLFQLDVMITTFYYFYPRSPCGERLTKTIM